MCIKRSGLWEFVVLSVVLLLYGLFSPCFAEAFVGSRAAIRAVRRGTLSTTYRDMRIGGRLGGQLGWLRSGSDAQISTLTLGYQYGFELLLPINNNFEFDVAALGSWKGGNLSKHFGSLDGTELDMQARLRIMSVNLALYINYLYRIAPDWDIFAGVGMQPQVVVAGRLKTDFAGGTHDQDLEVGFDARAHLFPLNFGLGLQTGVRYNSTYEIRLWYEHDFLNLLPKQRRFYGTVSTDYLMRHDFSLPFLQSFDRLATLACGISFAYYVKL